MVELIALKYSKIEYLRFNCFSSDFVSPCSILFSFLTVKSLYKLIKVVRLKFLLYLKYKDKRN